MIACRPRFLLRLVWVGGLLFAEGIKRGNYAGRAISHQIEVFGHDHRFWTRRDLKSLRCRRRLKTDHVSTPEF